MAQTPVAYYPLNGNANNASGNSLNGTITGTVLLYSAEGKILQQQTVTAQTMTMDMSKYAKEMYLLQYKTGEQVVNQKIIKQ